MSRSCNICEEIPSKCHPRPLGLNLHLVSNSAGFVNQALFIPLCEKCHPHLRTSGYQKPRPFLTRLCKSPGVTLLGLISDLGPFGLLTFYVLQLTCASWCDYRGSFLPISIYSSCGVNLALPLICSLSLFDSRDLTFPVVSFTLTISPSLLQLCRRLLGRMLPVWRCRRAALLPKTP
jgi:hypothetical protein